MMRCKNLGPVHATGDHADVYHCAALTACTLVESELKLADGVTPIPVCSRDCCQFVALESPDATGESVATDATKPERRRFAFVTGSNRATDQELIETMIRSARAVGVEEEFYSFTPYAPAGAVHRAMPANFAWKSFMAKVDFLLDLQDSDYEYLVCLDTDNYFVRDPGDFSELIRGNKCWVSMEGDLASPLAKTNEWWGLFLKTEGVTPKPGDVMSPTIFEVYHQFGSEFFYNTNAGLFIVRRDAIAEFHSRMWEVFEWLRARGFANVTEEPPLAIVGSSMVPDPWNNVVAKSNHVWECNWHHAWSNRLPDGSPWRSGDWVTQQDGPMVNPAIVHMMGKKDLMRRDRMRAQGVAPGVNALPGAGIVHAAVGNAEPVGAMLHAVLNECDIHYTPDCSCRDWIVRMDEWGIRGCDEHRAEILRHLDDEAAKTTWMDWLRVFRRGYLTKTALLEEAIARAARVAETAMKRTP